MSTSSTALPLSPLDPERNALLHRVVDGLDPASLHWLSGFAAGVAHARAGGGAAEVLAPPALPGIPVAARSEPVARLAVVYGSQSGNSKRVADRLGRVAEEAGLAVRVYAARDYPLKDLAKERYLSVVISTQGDGDPPDDARSFVEHVTGKRAPRLENLAYSVLALGDSSYPKFCETGRLLDERLAELGARRLLPRVDCDLDYERLSGPWVEQLVTTARGQSGAPLIATVTRLRAVQPAPLYSREQPFTAKVLGNQRITGRGATKDVRHIEISLEGSGLIYEPGDALGVWHDNPAAVVDGVLSAAGLDGAEIVAVDGKSLPLREWLTTAREVTRLTRPFIVEHARRSGAADLAEALSPGQDARLRSLLKDLQLTDLFRTWPAEWTGQELVQELRPLAPRLYSIASSRDAVGDEAHITVAVIDYQSGNEQRHGAASTHLAGLTGDEATARVFIEPNERFRLPADPARDVIMIGPGTGVAPYRGFLQQRKEQGATGRNWLVFGARHFDSEFLYQAEWQEAARKGLLHRVDLAFSRDRTPRAYVQDRLREAGADLYAWLERGASVYVCGDAERMAPDVHAALLDIVATHGRLDREGAQDYLRRLSDERRYLRDVY
ncbi:MAG TPA: assimilatory sulfite reductase (NADPH) flavoprotein subunit [Steroidobacteraceae bacterium]|nr:assimilatory sulfite reductase (NADPH) flavoprotein subunit [Steroidobacteraceae bacterium]